MKQLKKIKFQQKPKQILLLLNQDIFLKNKQKHQQVKKVEQIKIQFKTYFNITCFYNIDIKNLHHNKQYIFSADLGHFYQYNMLNGLHMKRIKKQDLGTIFQIGKDTLQFQATEQLVSNQFQSVKNLSVTLNKKQQFFGQNIKVNYILDYYSYLNDIKYGCYLFHEPIQMTLDEIIKQNSISYNQKLDIIQQILKIIEFLISLNICHRNLNPYNFVFVKNNQKASQYYKQKLDDQHKKNWKFQRQKSKVKICGFYQFIYIYESNGKKHQYPPLKFQNIYTDPNIYKFKNPQFKSDLWSVLIIIYQLIFGKLPKLNNIKQLQESLNNMPSYQHKFFQFYFKGTQAVNFSLKDFQIFVKNLRLTSDVYLKIKKQNEKNNISKLRKFSMNYEIVGDNNFRRRSQAQQTKYQ